MNKTHYQIMVVGGGTGGIMTASQLLRKSRYILDIGIIEPSETHIYQPAMTLVGAGAFKMAKTKRKEANQIPKGVKWIKDRVLSLDVDNNSLKTEASGDLTYDFLVLSPGISINLSLVEGLTEAMGKNDVCSNYIDPEYTWEVVQKFKGGNALYTQANTPIKCGGAPQKAMYLGEDYMRRDKVLREKTNVMYALPGSVIFGVPEFKKTLLEIVDERNLIVKYSHRLFKVDGEKKIAYYRFPEGKNYDELTHNDPENKVNAQMKDGVIEIEYDMMHLGPPMEAPEFIAKSKIAHTEGPFKGFANVNKFTMQCEAYPNVFGLGDGMGIPASKTGAAIRKQTPVLVDHLLAEIDASKKAVMVYNGYSSCPIVTGYGQMLLAEFDYDNNRDSDPILTKFFDTTKSSWPMWILKKYGLPFLYWTQMMKGKM
jgi:sulfide:quinone oxidoreductase